MYKGIYIATSGAVLKQKQLDVLAQNLANAATVGYKKDTASFRDHLLQQGGATPEGRTMSKLSSIKTDHAGGTVLKSDNPLDIALEGKGYLTLEGNRYTRRGDLRRDQDRYLTTNDGIKVLGKAGPIRLPDGAVEINPTGAITVNGAPVDTLRIQNIPEDKLTKVGNSLFAAAVAGTPSDATVRQGAVEASNVEVVHEMVQMMQAMREFETYQKVIQAFEEATAKINNDMGRL